MVNSRDSFILLYLVIAIFLISIYPISIGINFLTTALFFTAIFLVIGVRSRLAKRIDIITISLLIFILYFCVNIFFGLFDGGLWHTCLLFAKYVLSATQVKNVWYVLWFSVLGILFATFLFENNRKFFKAGDTTGKHQVTLGIKQLPDINNFSIRVLSVIVYFSLFITSVNVAFLLINESYSFYFRSYDSPLIQWHHRFLLMGQALAFLMPGISLKYGIKLKYIALISVGLSGLMIGQKIWIVTSVLYIIWFRFSLLQERTNRFTLFITFLVLVTFAGIFNETRAGRTGGGFLSALTGTSKSYCTIPYLDEMTYEKSYLFAPLIDRISSIFVSNTGNISGWDGILQESSNLSYHLTATINPIAFNAGNGVGTSLLAESYSFGGLVAVFVMYVLATITLLTIHQMIKNNHQRLLYLPLLLMHFLDIHRDSFFDFMILIPYILISYLLVKIRLKKPDVQR